MVDIVWRGDPPDWQLLHQRFRPFTKVVTFEPGEQWWGAEWVGPADQHATVLVLLQDGVVEELALRRDSP